MLGGVASLRCEKAIRPSVRLRAYTIPRIEIEIWPSERVMEAGLPDIIIRTATPTDSIPLAKLRALLWPNVSVEAHAREAGAELEAGICGGFPIINLIAVANGRDIIGFLEADLRSHADGCDPSRAVGYIEGWYVADEFRHRGIGRKLMAAAEDWARAQGCREIASDVLIENKGSQRAHESLGYSVVDRCVHYRKTL